MSKVTQNFRKPHTGSGHSQNCQVWKYLAILAAGVGFQTHSDFSYVDSEAFQLLSSPSLTYTDIKQVKELCEQDVVTAVAERLEGGYLKVN